MKISFLIHTIYGIGGTIRTTLNLAEEFAEQHEVEIVSVFKHRPLAAFDIDPRITLVPLMHTWKESPAYEKEHPLHLQPAEYFPRHEARYREYSKLTDERVRDHYADSDADVVIGTRPGLAAYVAQFAPASAVLIGQEHMTYNHHKPALRNEMYQHIDALDAYVTVSEGDAAVYRAHMPLPATRVLAISNSVPEPSVEPSTGSGTTIVAAGRLSSEKQYSVLVDAFAKVVAARPEWDLRIYGGGPEKENLRKQIDRLGLYNSVRLMGSVSPIEPEWAKGAVAASTSRHESFGMTLVEAMRCGLPVVSSDCDYGPREILQPGVDGLLVPVSDPGAVADALLTLIDDEPLRRRMSAAAVRNASRFDPGQVAKKYEELFGELRTVAAQRAAVGDFAPVGDCVVESGGALAFSLVAPQAAAVVHEGLKLVCVRSDVRTEEHVFPLSGNGTVTIPADEAFAEGIWECYAELPESGRRVRITARSIDQRGAMSACERARHGEPVHNLVPYATRPHKFLSLRSWVRPIHAEAGDIRVDGKRITVAGELFGVGAMAQEPSLVVRRRGKSAEELTYAGSRTGERGFRFTFPASGPAGRQVARSESWDLLLKYAPDAAPVKVARVLDDVVEKRPIYEYPVTEVRKSRPWGPLRRVVRKLRSRPAQWVRVRIMYMGTNDLIVNVADAPLK
ncbi:glycosyltransferase family 4 protein [Streptomyces sp. NPDC057137]|uniref:glycosyltransferase family 4 protein n=1 Tax=Streptomyces sp. NPDC057137 TaxID=3346030 RepID=UPI003633F60F